MDKKVSSRSVRSVEAKALSCVFLSDVLCSFRKSKSFGVMERCFSCENYKRFVREMDEFEAEAFDEAEKVRKYGYPRRF